MAGCWRKPARLSDSLSVARISLRDWRLPVLAIFYIAFFIAFDLVVGRWMLRSAADFLHSFRAVDRRHGEVPALPVLQAIVQNL